MGRGRQKAKDAKIARELKYTNHGGDLRALERELLGTEVVAPVAAVDTKDSEDDLYDRWAVDDEDEDEDDDK